MMLLPIIDSFIREVNNLAGDPSSPSFDKELSSCLFVMVNETNPVDLGYKFVMLNISLSVLRKILTYLSILKLRSDSLRSPDGKPINQAVLTLALGGIVYAIGKEEEPISNWKPSIIRRVSQNQPTAMETSFGEEKKGQNSHHSPVPSTSTAPPSAIPIPGRSVRQSSSNRSSRNSTDSLKAMTGPRPGTSKQLILYKQNVHRSEGDIIDESTPGKQVARGLHTPIRGTTHRSAGRRGRTASVSSAPLASPLPLLAPSSLNEPRPELLQSPPTSMIPTAPRPPVIPTFASVIVSPGPSRSNVASTSSTLSSAPTFSASTSTVQSPDEPTFGLIVTFDCTVSIPIQQGLFRVLEPYRGKIETTPICANHLFIKLKDKKDVYFFKRQIEILTRLMPKIVVTKFSRFQLDVPKQLAPTIKEFVNLNASLLKGEYYVYSRISTSNENITTIEILADTECQQSIESYSCLLRIGQETRKAVLVRRYLECPRCFFCYDDAHTECSQKTLMEIEYSI